MPRREIDVRDLEARGFDVEGLAGLLSYGSRAVRKIEIDHRRSALIVEFEGTESDLDALLDSAAHALSAPRTPRRPAVLYEHRRVGGARGLTWNDLCGSGAVREVGRGRIAYSGVFLETVEAIDRALSTWARARGAEPIHFPNAIAIADLRRGGYFDHFPQLIVFSSPLRRDLSTIAQFQTHPEPRPELFEPCLDALKTSACAPLYPALAGQNAERGLRWTMVGDCTRHEGALVRTAERLSEFRMREIVHVGDEAGAKKLREEALALFRALIEALDLSGRLMTAFDPFFVTKQAEYRLMQSLGRDKIEARVLLEETQTEIAVASFNDHHELFGRRFDIQCGGETAVSCCAGVGLERLAYAALSRHGGGPELIAERLARLGAAEEER